MKLAAVQRWPERHPVALGLSISGVLLLILVVQTALLDRFTLMLADPNVGKIFRIAVVHCLQAGYFPAAYYALLRGTRGNVREIEKSLDPAGETWGSGSAVRVRKKSLLISCTIVLLGAAASPYLTSDTPPWNPSMWPPELWWHRLLGLFTGLWTGCLFAAVWDTAALTSRLADRVEPVDLLDLSVWSPFVKQGLLTALLVIGGFTVQALRLYEPQERIALAGVLGVSLPLALLGLWLPVRGAHRRISQTKEAELARISEKIRQASAVLLDDAADESPRTAADQMPGLVAYRQLIQDVPEWPFQTSTFVQMALYLLIPIGSLIAKELAEGLVGRLFG